MNTAIKAFAAVEPGKPLEEFEFKPGPLGDEEVEIKVRYCGICHSDLSMIRNEWGITQYPLVAGHEIIGEVVETGKNAKRLKPGDLVGVGWDAESCFSCKQCLAGDQHLCPNAVGTIVGHRGGFAERVRCHWAWAFPLPAGIDPATAGPLFCGGITVFSPILLHEIMPTAKVAVIGIGGLGHMALRFLNRWGCEVTAFTSSEGKREEALRLGAHHAVNSRDPSAIGKLAGAFDFILSTVNVPLDWPAVIAALAPKGRLHFVGALLNPMPTPIMPLIMGQREISASPTGNIDTIAKMLDFAARHQIAPVVEQFPMSRINDAFAHLSEGKARYRIVLENDLWK